MATSQSDQPAVPESPRNSAMNARTVRCRSAQDTDRGRLFTSISGAVLRRRSGQSQGHRQAAGGRASSLQAVESARASGPIMSASVRRQLGENRHRRGRQERGTGRRPVTPRCLGATGLLYFRMPEPNLTRVAFKVSRLMEFCVSCRIRPGTRSRIGRWWWARRSWTTRSMPARRLRLRPTSRS